MNKAHFITRRRCPACRSERQIGIYSCGFEQSPIREYLESFYSSQGRIDFQYLTGSAFTLVECGDCGMVFQREIPDDFLLRKLYQEWIDPDKVFHNQDRSGYYTACAREMAQVVSFLSRPPNQLRVLDFGMGWGRWCLMAKAFGCDVYGTELSAARIKHARSNGIKVIAYDKISGYRFDFINAEQIFEHLPEPLGTLKHLSQLLKPKGFVKISVPDGSDIRRRLRIMDWNAPKGSRNSLNPVSPLEHINCFDHRSLSRMAGICALKAVRMPLRIQYVLMDWGTPKQALRSLFGPLYRRIHWKSTYQFFRKTTNQNDE